MSARGDTLSCGVLKNPVRVRDCTFLFHGGVGYCDVAEGVAEGPPGHQDHFERFESWQNAAFDRADHLSTGMQPTIGQENIE